MSVYMLRHQMVRECKAANCHEMLRAVSFLGKTFTSCMVITTVRTTAL